MSESDFEDFEEPEEAEIVEDGPEGKVQSRQPETGEEPETLPERVPPTENGEQAKETRSQPKEVGTGETKTGKGDSQKDENTENAELTPKSEQENKKEKGEEEPKEEIQAKKVERTPEKKTIKNVSSAQKPSSSFHPISQDSDANLNSKLSESFTMVTAEAKTEIQSGIDLKNECHNLISPNNQRAIQDATTKETQSLQNKSATPTKKIQNEEVQEKYPFLFEWVSRSKGTRTNAKVAEMESKIVHQSPEKLRMGLEKSVLGRFRKLKVYKKLVQMKEEIQNNSCKEMKGLSQTESQLLSQFLDGLFFLPDPLSKDLLDFN